MKRRLRPAVVDVGVLLVAWRRVDDGRQKCRLVKTASVAFLRVVVVPYDGHQMPGGDDDDVINSAGDSRLFTRLLAPLMEGRRRGGYSVCSPYYHGNAPISHACVGSRSAAAVTRFNRRRSAVVGSLGAPGR